MIGITVDKGSAVGAWLTELALRLEKPDDLLTVLGREGGNRLRAHFRRRDTVGNQLGGRRTHFWQAMADSVSSRRSGVGRVLISVTDPRFVQKVYGGTVVPKNGPKALTIPVNPAAYGRKASVYEQETGHKLFVIVWSSPHGNSIGALCAKTDPAGKLFEVIYLLMAKVNQKADPQALPDRDEWSAGLIDRAEKYVSRILTNPPASNNPA